LAVLIADKHQEAETKAHETAERIRETIEARLEVAALVDTAKAEHGKRLKDWWSRNLPPTLSMDAGRQYMRLHRIADREAPDKRQLMLAGILGAPVGRGEQQRQEADPMAWATLIQRLTRELEKQHPKNWPNGYKIGLRRPLAALADKINATLAAIASGGAEG